MTHWPYIAISYALVALTSLILGLGATLRLRQARTRLAMLETRTVPAGNRP